MREELTKSFAALAATELLGLRRFAYALCGDWHHADDLVQGALERMYVAWPRVHGVADPGAYLRTVLARVAISETRRPWRREKATDVLPEPAASDATAAVTDRLDLAAVLAGLTVKQRAVVVLRFVEDRSVTDVAEILGVAPGTVKRQCHDALKFLRTRLGAQSNEEASR